MWRRHVGALHYRDGFWLFVLLPGMGIFRGFRRVCARVHNERTNRHLHQQRAKERDVKEGRPHERDHSSHQQHQNAQALLVADAVAEPGPRQAEQRNLSAQEATVCRFRTDRGQLLLPVDDACCLLHGLYWI